MVGWEASRVQQGGRAGEGGADSFVCAHTIIQKRHQPRWPSSNSSRKQQAV